VGTISQECCPNGRRPVALSHHGCDYAYTPAEPKLKKLRGAKIMKNERETPVPTGARRKYDEMMQLASSAPSAALMMLLQSRIRPSTR